ncbi:MAG: hypothetical protein NUV47_00220 [Patescibacteria group bacterium]|nr:hypothetical protein [Patescibacteria group bacterium]
MNPITNQLRTMYEEEVADIRRKKHYSNPKLDLEDILKKSVLLGTVSDHFNRFMAVMDLFDKNKLKTGEDYFYASFILSQEDEAPNLALGCMLAQASGKLNFSGNIDVPDVDEYIKCLQDAFFTRLTGIN